MPACPWREGHIDSDTGTMNVSSSSGVTRGAFEERLRRALDGAPSAEEGLFGPGSVVWQVARHNTVYLPSTVLGAFMDVAHPWIAQGVAEHSRLFSDIQGRLALTYSMLMRIVFGDLPRVRKVGRGLYSLHSHVEGVIPETSGRFAAGSAYAANETQALLWVHLVFFYTRARMYELTVRPLTAEERRGYVEESKRFAACFGIPEDVLPGDYEAMLTMVEEAAASDRFARCDASTEIVGFLVRHVPAPLRPTLRGFLSELLPEPMLGLLGFPARSRATRLHFRLVRRTLWLFNRVTPPSLRYAGPYHEALARLGRRRRVPLAARAGNLAVTRRPSVLT